MGPFPPQAQGRGVGGVRSNGDALLDALASRRCWPCGTTLGLPWDYRHWDYLGTTVGLPRVPLSLGVPLGLSLGLPLGLPLVPLSLGSPWDENGVLLKDVWAEHCSDIPVADFLVMAGKIAMTPSRNIQVRAYLGFSRVLPFILLGRDSPVGLKVFSVCVFACPFFFVLFGFHPSGQGHPSRFESLQNLFCFPFQLYFFKIFLFSRLALKVLRCHSRLHRFLGSQRQLMGYLCVTSAGNAHRELCTYVGHHVPYLPHARALVDAAEG